MLNFELRINKTFKEKLKNNMTKYFSVTTMMPRKKYWKNITLVFFYLWYFMKTERTSY